MGGGGLVQRPPPLKSQKQSFSYMIFSSRYCGFFMFFFFSILNILIFFLACYAHKRRYLNSRMPHLWCLAKIPSFYCISAFTAYHIFQLRILNDVYWCKCIYQLPILSYRQTLWRRIRAVLSGSAMFATRTLNGLADVNR